MKERKYQEDWVNESRIDDQGKEKRVPVYRGPRFTLPEGESRKGLAAKALAAWAGYALPLLAYFLLDFPGSRVLYVFLPAALGIFPCLYWAMGVWGIFRAEPVRMTRLQKETGLGRVLRSAAGCALCSAAALVGDAVYLLAGGGDFAKEGPGMAVLAVTGIVAFGAARLFRTLRDRMKEEAGESTKEGELT